jgi:hypothetical protein
MVPAMKLLILVIIFGAILYYAYKDWTRETPAELLELAPKPTPEARFAPEGVFYVVRAFSVTHDEGIHGFPRGRKVRLVRRSGNVLLVTDGYSEGQAPIDHFTNDLDQAERLIEESDQLARHAEQRRQQELQLVAENTAQMASEAATSAVQTSQKRRQEADLRLKKAKLSLEQLEDRISTAQSERSIKGYPIDGGPRRQRDGRIFSISPDAANIRQLLEQRLQMRDAVRRMELQLQEMRATRD